jgi:hypothetical protein
MGPTHSIHPIQSRWAYLNLLIIAILGMLWIRDPDYSICSGAPWSLLGSLSFSDSLVLALRDWRDSSWSTASNLMKGASPDTRMQRKALLGENVIDVKGKSVFVLLVEEVRHQVLPLVEAGS